MVAMKFFISINILSFSLFSFDKFKAKIKGRRVSEKTLHILSLAGGILGSTFSMALFRHKTSKTSFLIKHIAILLLWIVGSLYYFTQINELNFLR